MKISLRMDLSSFIDTDYEKNIVDKLSEIHGDGIKYYTTLWYREGSITSDAIQKFLVKYEKGTARICSQKMKFFDYDYIVNIQGDMLDITYETIEPIIKTIGAHRNVITAYTKGYDPNGVKIIRQGNFACWFTRSDIGYGDSHLGIYAYPWIFLDRYFSFSENYPSEDLEQNRILGSHYRVMAVEVEYNGREINTKLDYEQAG